MKFRIYRLPGLGIWWLLDHGPGTPRVAIQHWSAYIARSVQMPLNWARTPGNAPHAWIEVPADGVHVYDNTAHFYGSRKDCK